MTRKEKETMKLSVGSKLWCFIDRKVNFTKDLKNEILHLIHTFGKQNDGEDAKREGRKRQDRFCQVYIVQETVCVHY